MVLDTGDHAVVMVQDTGTERVACLDEVQDSILATGADMAETLVTFAHDGFPNQELRGIDVGQLVRTRGVLRHPIRVNGAGVAILYNAPDERLDRIPIDGFVVSRGVVVPKGFVFGGEGFAVVDGDARFDTVRHFALVGANTECGEHIIGVHVPAVHELEIIPLPMVTVGVRAARETDHIDFGALPSGLGRDAKTDEHGKAHEQSHDQCHTFSFNG